jgi:uncharacterized protein YciW
VAAEAPVAMAVTMLEVLQVDQVLLFYATQLQPNPVAQLMTVW